MADESENIVVEIDDPVVESQAQDKEAPKVETKDEGIEAVRAQVREFEEKLNTEREEKEAARRRAEAAEREAAQIKTRVVDTEIDAVANALAVSEMELDTAKRDLKKAMEDGDFDGVVSANEKLAQKTLEINRLKEGKDALEARSTKQQVEPADPFENYVSRFTPRSQDYLRKHKEVVTDPKKNKLLIAAHYEAEANGHTADTDGYFDFIDQRLGYKAVSDKQEPKTQAKGTTPAAPVSRSVDSSSSSTTPNVIKLSAGEARAATDGTILWNHGPDKGKPIGVKEYARRKALMQREGLYNSDPN